MQAGHNCFVGYAVETGTITESADGFAPATLPAAPTGMAFVGRTNVPEQRRGLNNGVGFAVGDDRAQYLKRGTVTPGLTIALRAGSLGLLQKAVKVAGVLPWLTFWVGVPGLWTDIYRFGKIGNLQISGRDSQSEAAEIEATLQIEAQCRYRLFSALNPSLAALAALGTPLMWTDVRGFDINDSQGGVWPQRLNLTAFSTTIDHRLMRGVTRPDFGDDQVLARTSSELKEMTLGVSGDMTLNKRPDEALFTASQRALSWGDMPLLISDVTQSRQLGLTFKSVIPGNETGSATEPGAVQTHSIPFLASDVEMTTVG